MSFDCSWIAVRGMDRDTLCGRLGLEAAGEVDSEFGADYVLNDLADGWSVVLIHDRHFEIEPALAAASEGADVLGCEMSEITMYSSLSCYRDGAQLWSVVHDPDEDVDGVSVEGEPPPAFAAILKRRQDQRDQVSNDDVDFIFDVPIDLSVSLCGFRADQCDEMTWTALTSPGRRGQDVTTAGRRPSFLARLFGRKA